MWRAIRVTIGPNEHDFRSHRQQQPGIFAKTFWPCLECATDVYIVRVWTSIPQRCKCYITCYITLRHVLVSREFSDVTAPYLYNLSVLGVQHVDRRISRRAVTKRLYVNSCSTGWDNLIRQYHPHPERRVTPFSLLQQTCSTHSQGKRQHVTWSCRNEASSFFDHFLHEHTSDPQDTDTVWMPVGSWVLYYI